MSGERLIENDGPNPFDELEFGHNPQGVDLAYDPDAMVTNVVTLLKETDIVFGSPQFNQKMAWLSIVLATLGLISLSNEGPFLFVWWPFLDGVRMLLYAMLRFTHAATEPGNVVKLEFVRFTMVGLQVLGFLFCAVGFPIYVAQLLIGEMPTAIMLDPAAGGFVDVPLANKQGQHGFSLLFFAFLFSALVNVLCHLVTTIPLLWDIKRHFQQASIHYNAVQQQYDGGAVGVGVGADADHPNDIPMAELAPSSSSSSRQRSSTSSSSRRSTSSYSESQSQEQRDIEIAIQCSLGVEVAEARRSVSQQQRPRTASSLAAVADRSIRDDQDLEYQEALEADRKRKEAKEDEKSRHAQAQSLEQAFTRMMGEAQARAKAWAKEEPAQGTPGTVNIRIRLPNGESKQRKCSKSDKMEVVFGLVEGTEYHDRILVAEKLAAVPFSTDVADFTWSYNLACTYPRQVFTDPQQTLEQANIKSNCSLVVELVDKGSTEDSDDAF
jgi:hypothetical protein